MKKIVFLALLLSSCSALKDRDIDYRNYKQASIVEAAALSNKNNWINTVFAVKKAEDSDWAYGSCVGIGYDSKSNQTYLATAYHVISKAKNGYVLQTETGKLYKIANIFNHPSKDIAFISINGKLPIASVYRGTPASDYDITLGYLDGKLDKKGVLVGKAISGQSGGGVFSNTNGLFGIVSTTGEAVLIWSAAQDLQLDKIIGHH